MHHGLHKQCMWFARNSIVHFGLHKLQSCILVCTSTHVFPTHFAYFIGVHSGLAYTPVIHMPVFVLNYMEIRGLSKGVLNSAGLLLSTDTDLPPGKTLRYHRSRIPCNL